MIGIATGLISVCCSILAMEMTPHEEAVVSHERGNRIYVVQCGLDATIFVLEYFHLEYPLNKVSSGLPLTEKGTALSDIQQMLSGFGLATDARRNVTVRQLTEVLNSDVAAIVPLTTSRTGAHYFVAVVDNDRRPVLVDPPRKVHRLPAAIAESQFEETGGVVLFVRRKNGSMPRMSEQVAVSPKSIELGQFPVTGSARTPARRLSFSLANNSDSPIMVSDVQASCGCLDIDWSGGLLGPGERRVVHFAVFTEAMGGVVQKAFLLKLADGSTLSVPIRGEGVTAAERQRIEVSQDSICIDITKQQRERTIDVRLARVETFGSGVKDLTVTSEADWLKPRMFAADAQSGDLRAEIDVSRVMAILEVAPRKVVGEVNLSTNSDLEPASVKVEVVRRDFFRVQPALLEISIGKAKPTTALLMSNEQDVQIKVVDVTSVPPGLEATVLGNHEEAAVEVSVREPDALVAGYHLLVLVLESTDGIRGVARVPLKVLSGEQ